MEEKKEPKYNVGRPINLITFDAVKVVRSVRRAQKRGKVTPWGVLAPKRPFNNRKRTAGREQQLLQEKLYGQVRARFAAE